MSNILQQIPAGVLLVLAGALLSCNGQNGREQPEAATQAVTGQNIDNEPVIVFDTLIHDFGTIIEGESVVCYFDYRNGGGGELIITSVEASCGCTTPDWNGLRSQRRAAQTGYGEIKCEQSGSAADHSSECKRTCIIIN
jgi:hypothetical protein